MPQYKLGRKPYVPSKRDLKLSNYLKVEILPPVPDQYGYEQYVTEPGNALGNTDKGNCVICAIYRMIMIWNASRGIIIKVSPQTVINTYYKVNGTTEDNGTDERTALVYALNIGFPDDDGNIHKIGGFVNIDVTNQLHLDFAAYNFEGMLLGIDFPDSAMTQTNNGVAWDVVPNATIIGGHGIDNIAKRINRICMTWGLEQPYTLPFQQAYLREAWGVWSPEMFINGKTINGIDEQQLLIDQQTVQDGYSAPPPQPTSFWQKIKNFLKSLGL